MAYIILSENGRTDEFTVKDTFAKPLAVNHMNTFGSSSVKLGEKDLMKLKKKGTPKGEDVFVDPIKDDVHVEIFW